MGDKRSSTNFPRAPRGSGGRYEESGYNTEGYYEPSRRMGESRYERPVHLDDDEAYDDSLSGKREDYKAGGYYGSNYGSISEPRRGRDIERNAGYRENYDRLPSGQWPDIQEAADRRGTDLHWRELQERGVHRGKGPRGYQRSDYRIHEDIHDVLYEDPYIDATDIEVKVEKGEVILTGTVESRHIKRRVEDLVEERVSGIRHLENRIRPRLAGNPSVNIGNSGEH